MGTCCIQTKVLSVFNELKKRNEKQGEECDEEEEGEKKSVSFVAVQRMDL